MMGRIKLLIADDHPVVRMGLRGMLDGQEDFEVVGEVENGAQAVEATERLRPDVVLMDLRMPEMDGVAATTRIVERTPEARVLVLTTSDSGADILRAVEIGATGYILKDAPREELFRAVRAAAEGKPLLAPDVAAHLMNRVRWPSDEALSSREIEVLELVAQGTSNRNIAGKLWISEATVKSHLLHIYGKLGASDRASAVSVAMKRGILRS
ncbi:MAG TPA: response regulator transcription factor [Rubrobacteraceae bacterium]|nr:response regulator transcription factor [Rubrobacteraceae bacterium]